MLSLVTATGFNIIVGTSFLPLSMVAVTPVTFWFLANLIAKSTEAAAIVLIYL